jgi:hypothetical protein
MHADRSICIVIEIVLRTAEVDSIRLNSSSHTAEELCWYIVVGKGCTMVDLGGYVIILVETKDKKIKLYGKYTSCYNGSLVHQYDRRRWLIALGFASRPVLK